MPLKRFFAYVIDYIIITVIASCLSAIPLINTNIYEYRYTTDSILKLNENYLKNDIERDEYQSNYEQYLYEGTKQNLTYTIIKIALLLAYFGYYQYKKGQTIGMKILKIKVVGIKENPNLKTYLLRIIILDNIIFTVLKTLLVYIMTIDNYYSLYQLLTFIANLINFVTVILIIFSQNKRGIHDILSDTSVVSVD